MLKPIRRFCIAFLAILFNVSVWATTELPRRASSGVSVTASQGGMQITSLADNSGLSEAGLKAGDILLSIDDLRLDSQAAWDDATDGLRANRDYRLHYRRNGYFLQSTARFAALAKEAYPNIKVEYGHLTNDEGQKQRWIFTRPVAQPAPPAIYVIQGLSCSSIEVLPDSRSNFVRFLSHLVTRSDMAVMRVEKPGMGDSEGRCSQTNFYTELRGYELGLQQLLQRPDIDRNNVVVYGSSLGSALAPYLAEKYQVAAVIADGTYFRTWFEHMLEIERRIKQMQGLNESQIHQQITQAYLPLYYGMLVQKRSYQQLIEANPLLAQYHYHGLQHMYGRPMAFYQQLQDFDIAGHWQKLTKPVRIRWGSHDWIMSEADNHMIVDSLHRQGNQDVVLYIHTDLDHWYSLHPSPAHSFHGKSGQWDDNISGVILAWLGDLVD